jgi:hypothetical protein
VRHNFSFTSIYNSIQHPWTTIYAVVICEARFLNLLLLGLLLSRIRSCVVFALTLVMVWASGHGCSLSRGGVVPDVAAIGILAGAGGPPEPYHSAIADGRAKCDAPGFQPGLITLMNRSTALTLVERRSTWAITPKTSSTTPNDTPWSTHGQGLVKTLVKPLQHTLTHRCRPELLPRSPNFT